MRSIRFAAVSSAVALVAGGVALAPAQASSEGPVCLPGYQVPVLAGPASSTATVVADSAAAAKSAPTATFIVTYHGFSAAAKASFQRAVNTWKTKVSSNVPITIDATWTPLGPGILGSAGPSYVWKTGGVYNVDAIANKKAGRQLSPKPDIVARFSSSFTNWHLDATPAPKGKYDFQSVVTHEIGHGLGFLGAGNVTGSKGSVQWDGINASYDRFTRLGASGTYLYKMPNNSTQLGSALRSNNVYFDSPQVKAANGGKPAKLYAPASWNGGSSYSHLDEATYKAGNINSLMTPQIGDGETIRTPGPITMGLFKTIGW